MNSPHDTLMKMTAHMPCRVIVVRGEPYMERYFMRQHEDGSQDWLHRFLRADSEEHVHSHPFKARSTILFGWYREERVIDGERCQRIQGFGSVTEIAFGTMHRIIQVEPNTWTLMQVGPERLAEWYFIDYNGKLSYRKSGGLDWWRKYGPRGAK